MYHALKYGFRIATLNFKLWGMLYLVNLLFAGLVVVPLLYYLGDKLAFTKATDRLIGGFDFTLFNDFLNQYPEFLSLMSTQTAMIGLLFTLLYIFLNGGILTRIKNYETDIHRLENFWMGCGKYFWRLLRLTIYFLIIHLMIALIFIIIFNLSIKGGLERFASEADIFSRAKWCLLGYVITALFFFMVQDYAKVMIVARDRRWIFQEFWGAFGLVIKNIGKTYGLYLLLFGIFIVLSVLYGQLNGWIHQAGIPALILFLIGQVYVLLQIGFKLVNLGVVTAVFRQTKK